MGLWTASMAVDLLVLLVFGPEHASSPFDFLLFKSPGVPALNTWGNI